MSESIKRTVDLLAKSRETPAVFSQKSSTRKPIFEVLVEETEGLKTRHRLQISSRVVAGQTRKDVLPGINTKVLQVVRIQ